MDSVGDRLRQARENQGREIAQIAAETRINAKYLIAIESDDFGSLPGGFFSKSFVHQYANALGVPESEIDQALGSLLVGEQAPLLPGQEPPKEGSDLPPLPRFARQKNKLKRRRLDATAILLVVIVVCTAIYAFWLRQRDYASLADLSGADKAALESADSDKDVDSEAEIASLPGQPPIDSSARMGAASMQGSLNLHIATIEETWVDITSNGRRLFRGLLLPKQTKNLTGLRQARLLVGNAGGLRITVNGELLDSIGSRGQVRVVLLTPEGAHISRPSHSRKR